MNALLLSVPFRYSTIFIPVEFTTCGRKKKRKLMMEIATGGTCNREGVEQELLLQGEKLKRKLQKVQQRRDHYARLYYQAIVELDATRVALTRAMSQITELQTQVIQNSSQKGRFGSNTTSPDSGASLSSAGLDHMTRQHRPPDTITQLEKDEHTYDEVWMHIQEQQPPHLRVPTGCAIPTGCPAPLAVPNSQYRRSFSLSQQDPVFIPEPPSTAGGSRHAALSQDYSFSEPRKFERTLSLPHKIHRPVLLNSSKLTLPEESTKSERQFSAFKQLTPQVLNSPQRQNLPHSLSPHHTSLGCDRPDLSFNSLSFNQLLTVCSQLAAPNCCVKKIELANCGLGQPQHMKIFISYLVKNKSIVQLSLPHNGIGVESLSLLMDSLQHCPSIKELLLRHNRIGPKCVTVIKDFLEWATVDALVLTGNEIEQHSHLLDNALPNEFSMECGRPREQRPAVQSQDSGLPLSDPQGHQHSQLQTDFPLESNFKDLHI